MMGWLRLLNPEDDGEDDGDDDGWESDEEDEEPPCLGTRLVFDANGRPAYVPVYPMRRCTSEGKCDTLLVGPDRPEQDSAIRGKPADLRYTHEISWLEKGKMPASPETPISHGQLDTGPSNLQRSENPIMRRREGRRQVAGARSLRGATVEDRLEVFSRNAEELVVRPMMVVELGSHLGHVLSPRLLPAPVEPCSRAEVTVEPGSRRKHAPIEPCSWLSLRLHAGGIPELLQSRSPRPRTVGWSVWRGNVGGSGRPKSVSKKRVRRSRLVGTAGRRSWISVAAGKEAKVRQLIGVVERSPVVVERCSHGVVERCSHDGDTAKVVELCSHGVATGKRPRPTMHRTGGFSGVRRRPDGRKDGLGVARSPRRAADLRQDETGTTWWRGSKFRRVDCGGIRLTCMNRDSRLINFDNVKVTHGLIKIELAVRMSVGGAGLGHVAHPCPWDPSWMFRFGLSKVGVEQFTLIHGLGPFLGLQAGLGNSVVLTGNQIVDALAEEAQISQTG